ncbi:MAG: hypothetical protein LAN84_15540 [Acidobacteriia bacterium]|nr:hypothetical protein [Terriglobia bacterium]
MKRKSIWAAATVLLTALILVLCIPQARIQAQQIGDQVLLQMKFIKAGPQTQGAGVLQTGEVNSLSAAVATATLTQVVAAPTSGSIYLRGILLEKVTATTGSVTVQSGTGTNCGTGTAVLLGPVVIPPAGYLRLDIQVPAAKALCLQTDAATTSVRALYD